MVVSTALAMFDVVLAVGVPSDQIQIEYCLYHIFIRTQPSDTDTDINIGGCEKNDICIRQNQISDISGSNVDTNRI